MSPGARAAAIIFSLDGVTFDDSGTASGDFALNLSNYLSAPIDITTTPGSVVTVSVSYGSGLLVNPPSNAPPATTFDFVTPGYQWALYLEFTEPLSTSSSDTIDLVPGGGTVGSYFGSYELCSYGCGPGIVGGTIRFVTAGDVLVPEPASLAILGVGVLATAASRRRRSSQPIQAA